ncbi:hypothetical protein DH2020_004253 [Rehmannia glutinosa]|uniref:AT-hook motif nuclear-localized protein n=1 Tax=Rehmannia glutinosa TaxID=99300 RepID=A0ABR0XP07_REHGL
MQQCIINLVPLFKTAALRAPRAPSWAKASDFVRRQALKACLRREGRFDILSLSGSFILSEDAGHKSRTGGLSIALAGPDGRVMGGSVAGLLIAASPSQVVVGSFDPDVQKEATRNYVELPKVNQSSAVGPSSSPSRGTLSESSGGAASPLNLSSGGCIDIPQGMSGLPWK